MLIVSSHWLNQKHICSLGIVHKAPIENLDCVSGEFCEGLWKFDCAEFFISDHKGESYQEFNIAPQGAWWNAEFEAYRRQTKAASDLGVKIYSKKNANQWEVGLSVPLSKLYLKPERANVSFILINADGQPQYVSFTNFSVKDPDFHLVSEFPSIAWSTHEV